jgi:hypothetical protein
MRFGENHPAFVALFPELDASVFCEREHFGFSVLADARQRSRLQVPGSHTIVRSADAVVSQARRGRRIALHRSRTDRLQWAVEGKPMRRLPVILTFLLVLLLLVVG